jgi:hypothetical protein
MMLVYFMFISCFWISLPEVFIYGLSINQEEIKMRFSDAKTRYEAQKQNPDCFSFYKIEDGYVCFYCAQALHTWKNQN